MGRHGTEGLWVYIQSLQGSEADGCLNLKSFEVLHVCLRLATYGQRGCGRAASLWSGALAFPIPAAPVPLAPTTQPVLTDPTGPHDSTGPHGPTGPCGTKNICCSTGPEARTRAPRPRARSELDVRGLEPGPTSPASCPGASARTRLGGGRVGGEDPRGKAPHRTRWGRRYIAGRAGPAGLRS